jgi:hypothetical protein
MTMPMSRQAAASLALMPGVVITFCPGWAGCVSAHAFAASLPWRCSVVMATMPGSGGTAATSGRRPAGGSSGMADGAAGSFPFGAILGVQFEGAGDEGLAAG